LWTQQAKSRKGNLSSKNLLITGAGGFIGRSLIRKALSLGYRVRGLEISLEKAKRAEEEFGIQVLRGGIENREIQKLSLQGIGTVINTAAIMKESGALEDFRKINVEATYQLADEAKKAKVRIFVQLSSVMVYGFHYPPFVDESGPLDGSGSYYALTKIEGENALLPLNEPPRFGLIILRPGDVYGPGSEPWVVRPLEIERKGLFALPSGGTGIMNPIYVENLADAVFLAIQKKVFGESLNLTDGYSITWKQYFTDLFRIAGRRPPRSMPYILAKAMVSSLSPVFKWIYGESPLSSEGLDFIMRPHAVSNEKAKKLLGFQPRVDYKTGMEEIRKWLRDFPLQKALESNYW